MNQPLQTAALANLIVASRLPAEGNFRRDAILGAMVGQVNPVAGALVAIRSADSLTALIRERDALKVQQPAPPPAPTGAAPVGGRPDPLGEDERKLVRELLDGLASDAKKLSESLKAPDGNDGKDSEPTWEKLAEKALEIFEKMAAAHESAAASAKETVINQDEMMEKLNRQDDPV